MSKAKLKRTALTQPNMSYLQWRYISNAKRTWREWQSQDSRSDHVKRVAQEIMDRGIVVGSADSYLGDEGRKALGEASASVLQLSQSSEVQTIVANRRQNDDKDYHVRLTPWEFEHSPDSPFLKVALDQTLLEIVSAYLGMWPRLHAVGAWLNFPTDDDAKQSQLWHRDPDDLKIVKVFIYLNDVSEENGPFCYIPETHPFSSGAGIVPNYKDKKRILDKDMLSFFPRHSWITCTGPANTMVLADTVGYHRGGKPTTGTRTLITFTYTSGTPFVKRLLQVTGPPTWITHPIQSCAL